MFKPFRIITILTVSTILLSGCYWTPSSYDSNYPGKDYKGKPEHDAVIHHQSTLP